MKLRNFEVMSYKCHKHIKLQLSNFHVPTRVVQNGDGSEVIFPIFHMADTTSSTPNNLWNCADYIWTISI